jgi:hypothetical protein
MRSHYRTRVIQLPVDGISGSKSIVAPRYALIEAQTGAHFPDQKVLIFRSESDLIVVAVHSFNPYIAITHPL